MEEFWFWLILFLIFIGIPVGFLWVLYFIGKKLESRKTGIVLASTVGFLYLLGAFYLYFEDEFFTKSQAREILVNNKIELKEDFEIINNETGGGMGDYYQIFSLKIGKNDAEKCRNIFLKNSETSTSKMIRNLSVIEYREFDDCLMKQNIENLEAEEKIFISKKGDTLSYEIYHE